MKQVIYRSEKVFDCVCTSPIFLFIPSTRTVTGAPFINATLIRKEETSISVCGNQIYSYYIEYDETQLLEPLMPVSALEIAGILCDGILTAYINWMVSHPVGVPT